MTEAQPVVLDVGNKAARAVLLGGAVSGAIGLFTYYACLTDQISGGTGTLIVAWIIGSVFFGIGLLCAFGWRAASRPRKLIFEAAGIRWDEIGRAHVWTTVTRKSRMPSPARKK